MKPCFRCSQPNDDLYIILGCLFCKRCFKIITTADPSPEQKAPLEMYY
jgi:hypothetical protein